MKATKKPPFNVNKFLATVDGGRIISNCGKNQTIFSQGDAAKSVFYIRDGKVKVTGEKPLHGLVIFFDFRSPEKEVVTSQKAIIDDGTLEPGRDGVFHNEMRDPPRAVNYTIRAFDNHEKELRVENPGPYIIE